LLVTVGYIYPRIYMVFSSILRRSEIFRFLTDRTFLTCIGIYLLFTLYIYIYIRVREGNLSHIFSLVTISTFLPTVLHKPFD